MDIINGEISIYNLYKIIDNKYKKLYLLFNDKELFTNKELFNRKKYKKLIFNINENTTSIVVFKEEHWFSSFEITKYVGSDKLYLEETYEELNDYKNKFVKKYYDEIMSVFSILEEYITIFNKALTVKHSYNENFLFEIKVCYDAFVILSLNNDVTYNDRNMDENIKAYKFDLARKTFVKIDELDPIIQDMIKEYFIEEKQKKIKFK